jgi:hypothetical protein
MMKSEPKMNLPNEIFSESDDDLCIVTEESSEDMHNRFDDEY